MSRRSPNNNKSNNNKVSLYMGGMTAAERIAEARRKVGMPVEEPPPKIFDDSILDDMQHCLLKLEQRVKEGPGTLGVEEVMEFEAASDRIVEEMKLKFAEGESVAKPSANVIPVEAEIVVEPEVTSSPAAPPSPEAATDDDEEETKTSDESEDDGPAYDGTGGLGLAKGTTNTYVIPGMDEMTPEEYRAALQKSISDRQTRRRENRSNVVGNRAAHAYLEQLGWGGASANLGRGDEGEKEEEK